MRTLYSVAGSIFTFDQLTKWFAVWLLKPKGSIPVLSSFLQLSFVENTGIAFGLFQSHPEVLTFLITVSILGLFICARFFMGKPLLHRIAYGFILGGAVGNWFDRICFGHVTDFLDVRIEPFFRWPVFNLADSFITVGVVLFIWFALRGR